MFPGTTTIRVAMETAQRIAALRANDGMSTDAVLREALDALHWSRMAEAALWDRAARADSTAGR